MTNENNPYDGFMDHDRGKTGRQWLLDFRSDVCSALDALDTWQQAAYSIACDAWDCNTYPENRLRIPSGFRNLTQIVALWSDVELHIDPTLICEFLRRLDNFTYQNRIGPKGDIVFSQISMTAQEIEEVLFKARYTFDRIFHATLAISGEVQLEKWKASQSAKIDSGNKFPALLPESQEVRDLCQKLQRELPEGHKQSEIARDVAGGDDKKAQSLLRQARRFPHLWKNSDSSDSISDT
jgi:hypothetical protein